jgi:hypothetical protein
MEGKEREDRKSVTEKHNYLTCAIFTLSFYMLAQIATAPERKCNPKRSAIDQLDSMHAN